MYKVNIVSGNIFDYLVGMDAIVNSNNQQMIAGSGVCGVIYKTANKNLLEEYCKLNFKENMKVNEVRVTPGFDLDIDIIHIYAPKYYESSNPLEDLLKGYENIFKASKEKNYKNIVSISIGTGIHGYSHEMVGRVLYNKLKELTASYKINFTLALSHKEIINLYIK